jgi:diaminopimelate epimerase
MNVPFVKMHGCGNDFVILDERSTRFDLSPAQVASIADRRTGIGFDQLISMQPTEGADVFMGIRNPDGSAAGACGNATRCVADILMRETGQQKITVRTIAGDLRTERLPNGLIRVNMGKARLNWDDIPLAHPSDTLTLDLPGAPAAANMGNPHVTFFVDTLDPASVAQRGPQYETHPLFPDRANVGFAQIVDRSTIRLQVWERGAGLTRACGSGACATLVNAHRRGLTESRATIVMDGGDLEIEWLPNGDVLMTGPTAVAFSGETPLA